MADSIFKDKTLLITGGTGSFGHTVLKHFLSTDIGEIRIFSRDEKKQDDMRHELQANHPQYAGKVKFYIGDVRNPQSIRDAMPGVNYIFHAAALKQVPSCEFFPMQAVQTNIIGTDNVLHAAIDAGVGIDDVLHHRLGDAHGVDGVGCLIGGQADNTLNACVDGSVQNIVSTDDVGLDGLHGEEFAGRNLFQSGSVENVVNTGHCVTDGLGVADITDVELDLLGSVRMLGLKLMAHIVLLLLVTRENADFLQVRIQEVLQNGRTKRTSTTSNHKGCVIKSLVIHNLYTS